MGAEADAQHVDERPAGVANRLQDLLQTPPAVVLDDDARARREIRFEVGVRAARIA